MDLKSKEIFNKITSTEEKARIFADLTSARAEIICKGTADDIFKVIPERVLPDKKLLCFLHVQEKTRPEVPARLICQFSLGGEKYFFKTLLEDKLTNYTLTLDDELFHLQRRQSYRIRIPASTRSLAEIVPAKTHKIKATPFDLSTGGCKLTCGTDALALQNGEVVQVYLKVGEREPLHLEGIVRHLKNDQHNKSNVFVGIQFEKITPAIEKSLFSITMELYRQFFSRVE